MLQSAALFVSLISVSSAGIKNTAASYFPLTEDSKWSYVTYYNLTDTYVYWDRTVKGSIVFNDTSYHIVCDKLPNAGDSLAYYRYADGQVSFREDSASTEYVEIPPLDSIGRNYDLFYPDEVLVMKIGSTKDTLTTPAARYFSLLRVEVLSLNSGLKYLFFYQKGVGLVALTDGDRKMHTYLVNYQVKH